MKTKAQLPDFPWIENKGFLPLITSPTTPIDVKLINGTIIEEIKPSERKWKLNNHPLNIQFWRLNKLHITPAQRASFACTRIRRQVHNSPETRFHYAIIEVAITDLTSNAIGLMEKRSAVQFLNENIHVFAVLGLDSAWVRQIINEAGLSLDIEDYTYKTTRPRPPIPTPTMDI